MSVLDDVKRYLWLRSVGTITVDTAEGLLEQLVASIEKTGFNAQLVSANLRLNTRVAELEQMLKETQKRTAAVIEDLKHQVDENILHKRIQALETQLKESKAQTASFRRALVQRDNRDRQP